MDYMDQILDEVESLAIHNADKGIAKGAQNVALESFFDGAEDLNTPANRTRVHMRYNVSYRRREKGLRLV